jgi:hypothetical protein
MKINDPPVQRLAKIPGRPSASQLRRAFRPYAISLGELALSWNSLHNNLAKLFELVVKSPSRRMGVSIWYSSDSDFAQRRMLRAAVQVAAQLTAEQRKDICWALARIDDALRHSRNDAIHAPLAFIQSLNDMSIKLVPDMGDHPRARSLWTRAQEFKDLNDLYKETRTLADALDDYVADIFLAIINPSEKSWPVRPKLPSAHRKKARK